MLYTLHFCFKFTHKWKLETCQCLMYTPCFPTYSHILRYCLTLWGGTRRVDTGKKRRMMLTRRCFSWWQVLNSVLLQHASWLSGSGWCLQTYQAVRGHWFASISRSSSLWAQVSLKSWAILHTRCGKGVWELAADIWWCLILQSAIALGLQWHNFFMTKRHWTVVEGFCSSLFSGSFVADEFACSLFCSSHGAGTSLPCPLKLVLGSLDTALVLMVTA